MKWENIIDAFDESEFPPMILLDITNICNLKCIHCPQPDIQAAKGFSIMHIPFAVVESIVAQLHNYSKSCLLRFVGDGEPMLHPQLLDMLELARQKTNCVINLTTNGTQLNSVAVDRILQSNIHMLEVSLDALTKDTYETIRCQSDYEKVMGNIFTFISRRKKLKASTKLLVSFVLQEQNKHELDAFRKFWQSIADFVVIRNLHSANNRVKQDEVQGNVLQYPNRYPCPHLWKRLIVDFKGQIKFCPTDWGKDSVIADVLKDGLAEAWKRVGTLRNCHRNRIFSDTNICGSCIDWATTPWDQGYERIVDKIIFKQPTLLPGVQLLED
jgi:sulfatase maturation enzyme AslB (radical SAM superfamily)